MCIQTRLFIVKDVRQLLHEYINQYKCTSVIYEQTRSLNDCIKRI